MDASSQHYMFITHRNGAPALLFHLSLLLVSTVDDTCETEMHCRRYLHTDMVGYVVTNQSCFFHGEL